ncbi:MAG: TolC family protein [Lentisphaeria bacterium]|nr:TolC family protein [Lentisphaeria bacterium]
MKTIILSLTIITTLFATLPAGALEGAHTSAEALPASLSLAAAKQIALADNPSLAVMAARVKEAEGVSRQARSAWFPSVSAYAEGGRLIDSAVLSGGLDNTDTYAAGLEAGWLIFNGFARHFSTRAAALGLDATRQELNDVRRLLVQGVSEAFLNCRLAVESARVARTDAQFNADLLDEARKRLDAGAGARADVLNFSVRKKEAENLLLQAEQNLQDFRKVLATLLGLPAGDLPAATVLAPLPEEAIVCDISLDHAVEEAMTNRPDLIRAELAARQAAAAAAAEKGDYLPSLSAIGSYGARRLNNPRFDQDDDTDSYLGLRLSWNLFDGALREGKVKAANARRTAAEQDLIQTRIEVVSDVKRVFNGVEYSRKSYANNQDIAAMNLEIRDIARKEYAAGKATLTRLNEAQTNQTRAESQRVQSRITLARAIERLRAAMGTDILTGE